jgi:hypothetical protein
MPFGTAAGFQTSIQMKRLFTLVSTTSSVLFVATAALWITSSIVNIRTGCITMNPQGTEGVRWVQFDLDEREIQLFVERNSLPSGTRKFYFQHWPNHRWPDYRTRYIRIAKFRNHPTVPLTVPRYWGGPWRGSIQHNFVMPFWLVALITAPLALNYARCSLLRRLRLRNSGKGLCSSCGYNLTGNTSGVCPECGCAIRVGANAALSDPPKT